jgi:hypothetical protein
MRAACICRRPAGGDQLLHVSILELRHRRADAQNWCLSCPHGSRTITKAIAQNPTKEILVRLRVQNRGFELEVVLGTAQLNLNVIGTNAPPRSTDSRNHPTVVHKNDLNAIPATLSRKYLYCCVAITSTLGISPL